MISFAHFNSNRLTCHFLKTFNVNAFGPFSVTRPYGAILPTDGNLNFTKALILAAIVNTSHNE